MKNKLKYFGIIFFSTITLTKTIFAGRPFVTEDAGVAGKGKFQIETSWDYLKWHDGLKENVFVFVPIYGITKDIELSLEIPFVMHNEPDGAKIYGIGDLNIVAKYAILEEDELYPAFAVKGVYKTTLGNSESSLSSGYEDYSLYAVATKSISVLTFHAMLGYTVVDKAQSDVQNTYSFGLAVDFALTEELHLATEIAGTKHPEKDIPQHPAATLLGITYSITDDIVIDGGLRKGMNEFVPDWNHFAGVTISF